MPQEIVLTYNQALDPSSVPATTDYSLTGGSVSAVSISGQLVILSVSDFLETDAPPLSYTPGTNPVRSQSGALEAPAFTNQAATNTLTIAPTATLVGSLPLATVDVAASIIVDFVDDTAMPGTFDAASSLVVTDGTNNGTVVVSSTQAITRGYRVTFNVTATVAGTYAVTAQNFADAAGNAGASTVLGNMVVSSGGGGALSIPILIGAGVI